MKTVFFPIRICSYILLGTLLSLMGCGSKPDSEASFPPKVKVLPPQENHPLPSRDPDPVSVKPVPSSVPVTPANNKAFSEQEVAAFLSEKDNRFIEDGHSLKLLGTKMVQGIKVWFFEYEHYGDPGVPYHTNIAEGKKGLEMADGELKF